MLKDFICTHWGAAMPYINQYYNKAFQGKELPSRAKPILFLLWEKDNVAKEDLARRLSIDVATVEESISKLEMLGLACSQGMVVSLSAEGTQLGLKLLEMAQQLDRHLRQHLTEQEMAAAKKAADVIVGVLREKP